jgi:transposase-like protein
MKNPILKIVKWFCRQLTFNELASAVVIFHEVLNNARSDIVLKPLEKPPHYREFRVDTVPPVLGSELDLKEENLDWHELQKKHEHDTGKKISPVKRNRGKAPPVGCRCAVCNAPRNYLYLNNGKLSSQVLCKICGHTSPTHQAKRKKKAVYFCPHCSHALFKWKESKQYTTFKCPNHNCPHYLNNKMRLNEEEKKMRANQKYNPNFKLHYQYREHHLSPNDLKVIRPENRTKVDLHNIRNSYHILGLVLTFTINLGLSSRLTRDALKGIFDISVSHQTVLNYISAAAAYLSPYVDSNCPAPVDTAAADETYIIVNGQWTYTWFVIDSKTRALCGYNLSQKRNMQPALALLYNCYGEPGKTTPIPQLVTDGNPSYDAAVLAYNEAIRNNTSKLSKKTVIGLKNVDKESTEYRQFKQLIERLNRTYKYHTRPRAGFKSFDGACALTTLFVAFYNFMRPHTSLNRMTPLSLKCLSDVKLMPDKWCALIQNAA